MENTLNFNPNPSTIMHIDLNSCFATVEQQANPYLRGKPIAVAAYPTPNGCILAPSIEAKECGVKTGMRVKDGKLLCPSLIILESDPWKYRNVHLALRRLLSNYTSDFYPKSIDEFVLNLEGCPCLRSEKLEVRSKQSLLLRSKMLEVGNEIKKKIREEIGDWLTVSVGIAPNRFLAKLASGLKKPDGLEEISSGNFFEVYSNLSLTDLPYIKMRNAIRLNSVGIYSVLDFYGAALWKLKAAFQSVNGYYWYLRLRGWEIDNVEFGRRSYGNSYALPKPLATLEELSPILSKLVEKIGFRLRRAGYAARGIHVAVGYRDGSLWHKGISFDKNLFDSREIYQKALRILSQSLYQRPVRDLAVSVFGLRKRKNLQLDLFEDVVKREKAVEAADTINERWGDFVITSARMLGTQDKVPDRIAFGGIKELEEFTLL